MYLIFHLVHSLFIQYILHAIHLLCHGLFIIIFLFLFSPLLRDVPGVLSQLLKRLSPSITNSMQLIVLEEGRGSLCDSEEGLSGCLEWICNEEETLLHFPNMSSILLDPSVKFILTVSYCHAHIPVRVVEDW